MKSFKILLIALTLINLLYADESNSQSIEQTIECIEKNNKKACQILIESNALSSLKECVATCQSIGIDGWCPKSCNSIGAVYTKIGDYNQAMEYFKKSISLGNEYSYNYFPYLHYKSGNMETLQILDTKCNQNKNKELQIFACNTLGEIYLEGRGIFGVGKGVGQNYKKAFDYLKKACEMGVENSQYGCHKIGILLRYGDGMRQDIQSAKSYFGKACDLGNQSACNQYNSLNKQ
ncbi:tetratricopeptide repeat protein [Helicobacter sp. T3_23-1056]